MELSVKAALHVLQQVVYFELQHVGERAHTVPRSRNRRTSDPQRSVLVAIWDDAVQNRLCSSSRKRDTITASDTSADVSCCVVSNSEALSTYWLDPLTELCEEYCTFV